MSAVIILILARLIPSLHPQLTVLRQPEAQVHLSFSPNELSIPDIILAIIIFVCRSILPGSAIPRDHVPLSTTSNDEDDIMITQHAISLTAPLTITVSDVQRYVQSIDHASSSTTTAPTPSSTVPSSPLHTALFLSALSEPAALLLLTRPQCPVRPLGAVNVRNKFSMLDLERCQDIIVHAVRHEPNPTTLLSPFLSDTTTISDTKTRASLLVTARLSPRARRVRRGLEIDVEISILDTNGPHELFSWIFTFLQFMGNNQREPRTETSTQLSQPTIGHALATLQLQAHEPSVWARLCKDYNPIHINVVAARALGFPSKIAHGNHVVAKSVCVLDQSGMSRLTHSALSDALTPTTFCIEVKFKRPVTVPTKLQVRTISHTTSDTIHALPILLAITKDTKVHVEIEIDT